MPNPNTVSCLQTHEKRDLRLTKYALGIILLGFCLVGRHIEGWPIMTWPMYSSRWPEFPEPVVSLVELRVENGEGHWHVLRPSDLFPIERVNVAEKVIAAAWTTDHPVHLRANRRYLLQRVQQTLPDVEIRRLQAWEVSWDVEPLALPPLDHPNPSQEILLGGFHVTLEAVAQGATQW